MNALTTINIKNAQLKHTRPHSNRISTSARIRIHFTVDVKLLG